MGEREPLHRYSVNVSENLGKTEVSLIFTVITPLNQFRNKKMAYLNSTHILFIL